MPVDSGSYSYSYIYEYSSDLFNESTDEGSFEVTSSGRTPEPETEDLDNTQPRRVVTPLVTNTRSAYKRSNAARSNTDIAVELPAVSESTDDEVEGTLWSDWFYLYEITEDGVRGNTQLLIFALFVMLSVVFLSAELVNWAEDIRYASLLPFLFLCLIVLESARVIYHYYDRYTVIPMFLNLIPLAWMLVVSREAHQFVAFFFLATSLIIYLQSGSTRLRVQIAGFTVVYIGVYAIATAIIEWFYVDAEGGSVSRGRKLKQPINWPEEITLMVCMLLLGFAFIPTVRYIELYAASMTHMLERVKVLENRQSARSGNIKTPISRVLALLRDVQEHPQHADERLSEIVSLLSTGELYKPTVAVEAGGGANATDTALVEAWLKETLEGGSRKMKIISPVIGAGVAVQPKKKKNKKVTKVNLLKELRIKFNPQDIMDAVCDWNFDVFGVAQMSGGRPLTAVAYTIFLKHGFIDTFDIDVNCLGEFFTQIEAGYVATNPYHNALHATDVMQTINYFIEKGGLGPHLTDVEKFACVVAAMIHDFEHPGVNNNFLVNTEHMLAIRYSDNAVLESHHLAAGFTIMLDERSNILAGLQGDMRKQFRKTVIAMVLATDMKMHFDKVGKFETKLNLGRSSFDLSDEKDKTLVLEISMKAADISNPAKAEKLCTHWARRITTEFYNQGDRERQHELQMSLFCDRTKNDEFPKSQVGFINLFVKPLFTAYTELFPDTMFIREYIDDNLDMWEHYDGELPS